MDFQRQPGFQDTARWVVIRVLWGAQSTIQLATYSIKDTGYRIQDTQRHRDTETQTHRDRDTGYRIKQILRSLVAPLKRGRRIYRYSPNSACT